MPHTYQNPELDFTSIPEEKVSVSFKSSKPSINPTSKTVSKISENIPISSKIPDAKTESPKYFSIYGSKGISKTSVRSSSSNFSSMQISSTRVSRIQDRVSSRLNNVSNRNSNKITPKSSKPSLSSSNTPRGFSPKPSSKGSSKSQTSSKIPISSKSPLPTLPNSPKIPKPIDTFRINTPPKRPLVVIPLSLKNTHYRQTDKPTRRKDFLGNTRLGKIEGFFKRRDIISGDEESASQLAKDKRFKEKKGKIGLGFDKISNQKGKPSLFSSRKKLKL